LFVYDICIRGKKKKKKKERELGKLILRHLTDMSADYNRYAFFQWCLVAEIPLDLNKSARSTI